MDIPTYEPAAALDFFKAGGEVDTIPAGRVSLTAAAHEIRSVKAGEIFGEMAALARTPRSATAVAKTPCRLIALDSKQFRKALAKKPAFALMLMKVMVARLREAVARAKDKGALSVPDPEDVPQEPPVFDPKSLADMVRGLCDDAPVTFMRNQVILEEGQVGTRMYAVLDGRIAVSINGAVVDRIGPGGMLGELALIDQSPRLASAVAEDNVTLQPINRNAFIALVKLDPELGAALLAALAERLHYLTGRLK
jgi:CRP/FNR family cyclic AMP-dependent transcriptional regulator